jgi:membrane protease subunit HflC
MNRLVIIGILVVAALYVVFSSLYVVNEREQGIVTRFGNIQEVKTEPGIYFKIPTDLIDAVQLVDDRLLRFDLRDRTVQVSGGAFYQVDAFLTYRIVNARLFRERSLGDLQIAEQRIGTQFDSALRQVYGLREFNAALSEQRNEMMREARDLIRPEVLEIGIDVTDVRIVRTDLAAEVSERTFDRMRAERLAEAALLRARGQEAAASLRAVADRQAVEIIAAASRDSEILRGEGDAERSEIFANAYGQDPEFFQFYRSMQSYRTALGASGTTMVLSPDSEFFQYFGGGGESVLPEGVPALPAVDAPAADAPAADDPATEAPATDAPATDVPATEAPAADAPAADTPAEEPVPPAETTTPAGQ